MRPRFGGRYTTSVPSSIAKPHRDAGSRVFVTGISLAVSAMISLFGEAAAPHRAGGMALNGFVLFLGASIGPLAAALGLSFPALLTVLAALLVMAAICLTGYTRLRG